MASYSIVLNLSGNAVSQAHKLSKTLGVAYSNSVKLAAGLKAVNAELRAMPSVYTGMPAAGSRGGVKAFGRDDRLNAVAAQRLTAAALSIQKAATKLSVASNRQSAAAASQRSATRSSLASMRGHTRSGANNPFISRTINTPYGNVGQVLTFSNPEINAALGGLLKLRAGILSLVGVLKTVGKGVAFSTLAPHAAAGGVLALGNRMLFSDNMDTAIQLISRRRQAQLSMGPEQALAANRYADQLVAAHGFDRASVLSNMTVMTGAGIAGDANKKITIGQAAELSKAAGLISQQSGAPLEKVMTNLQQLLLQAKPNLRDIRELINQAPILTNYAIKEMQAKGVTGVDARDYLKDQQALLNTIYRFVQDVEPVGIARIRGDISVAKQDMWAKWAGNNDFFNFIGANTVQLLSAFGDAVNKLMTSVQSSPEMNRFMTNLSLTITQLGDAAGPVADRLAGVLDVMRWILGLNTGDRSSANDLNAKSTAYHELSQTPEYRAALRAQFDNTPTAKAMQAQGIAGDVYDKMAEREISTFIAKNRYNREFLDKIFPVGMGYVSADPRDKQWFDTGAGQMLEQRSVRRRANGDIVVPAGSLPRVSEHVVDRNRTVRLFGGTYQSFIYDPNANNQFVSSYGAWSDSSQRIQGLSSGGIDSDAMTGNNRDRRALQIHFHAPIVEWTSTIESTSPQETVDEVAVNLEKMASAAIQKALLGASNRMSSRWY